MRRTTLAATVLLASAYAASFDAASIKVNHSANNSRLTFTPGRISFVGATVKECVMAAYDLRDYQVVGAALSTSERYDAEGKAAGAATTAELRAMLQSLLADRFQLKVHRETRDLPAYRLIATKSGPKLTRATGEAGGYGLEGGSVVFHGTSIAAFADYLSRLGPVDRPVVDGTGIGGLFDFRLNLFEARPDMPLNELKRAYYEWDQGSSIFTDLQEQLGLKLQPEKAPIQMVVVDSVARPSEN